MLTGIILAAGLSQRMGTLKQLLPWQGKKTVLETVVETVLACPEIDDEVRVVLGASREQVAPVLVALSQPRLVPVENPSYRQGMLSSVQAGVRSLPETTRAFALFLGDQPLLASSLVRKLARQWRETQPDFLVPLYQGRRGHPVFIHRKYVPEILAMAEAEGGLRNLLRRHGELIAFCPVDSPAIYQDIDYPEEYHKYRPKEGES